MDGVVINLVILCVTGGIVSAIANSKGRSAVGWFFLGFFFPCIAFIIILCLSDLNVEERKWQQSRGEQRRLREQLRQERIKSAGFQKKVDARLAAHDSELNMDTQALGGPGPAPAEPPLLPFEEPEPAKTDEVQWYYAAGGRKKGPVDLAALRALKSRGEIGEATLVWNRKLNDWKPIREIPWLLSQLG